MVTCYRLKQWKVFFGYTDKRFFCECLQSRMENICAPRGGGIPQQSFILWSSAVRSSSLTFYIFLLREKVPLPYTVPLTDKWYPFRIPSLELCISFSCCKCTVFKLWINHKTDQEIVSTFSQPQNPSVSPFRSFCRPKWHIFPYPLIYFNHTWSLEKEPISQFGRRFPI